jgi:hypothetical protein
MSAGLIALVGFIYFAIAVEQMVKDNLPMAIVFAGYGFSNIGLFILAKG